MDSQIIVAAHVPVEITKPQKVRLSCIVWEPEAFLEVLNGMKGQIIQKKKKSAIRGIEVSLNTLCEWF